MSKTKLYIEILLRITLLFIFIVITDLEAYEKKVMAEEIWRYMYPKTKSIVPLKYFRIIVITIPTTIIFINYNLFQKDRNDLRESLLSFTMALELCGIVTAFLKAFVGKLRPDFYWRCFPNGFGNRDMICHGKKNEVNEGRKSFPSGHTSIGFASMGFLTLYLCGKFHVFVAGEGRTESWKFLFCLLPLFLAAFMGVSRIVDYHHDEIDVMAGMFIGIAITYLCYRQHYPSLNSPDCHIPYLTKEEVKNKLHV